MIAKPQAVPSISFFPTDSDTAINPVGWVYEICPRSAALPGNQCPVGTPTVSGYGGVRLALRKGDTLKIRLVNRLPTLDPIKVTHSADAGGANLPLNLTNLHTHGLVVPARAPTLADPTFGDFVFVEIYNPANGTPQPQGTHQHGSVVNDYADYRIDIPANHPSGAFWFHPHIHGLTLNQLSSGLSGIISVGSAGDYAFGDVLGTPFPESAVRHLILKDMQVIAANTVQQFANGISPSVNGEVLNQQDAQFCNQNGGEEPPRMGSCPGRNGGEDDDLRGALSSSNFRAEEEFSGGVYPGGRWFFTVSGQKYPTIEMTNPDGELWRFTNAAGNVTYNIQLTNDADLKPIMMQLVSVDGVSINVPSNTPLGTQVQLGGARFSVVACPANSGRGVSSAPVCIDQFAMMPSSRAEVWVTYRDSSGNIVTPPTGATGTLKTTGIMTGPAGDTWPAVDLATIKFAQTGPRRLTASALDIRGDARTANLPKGVFAAVVPNATPSPLPAACKPLVAGHRRRIFFGLVDTNNSAVFGLGYEEVDGSGVVVAGTQVPVSTFDPSMITVCLPLGPGQLPVHEIWEVVNLATENHNFHIHQTKFRLVQDGATTGSPFARVLDTAIGAGIMEDNMPLPAAIANISDIADLQGGYCTIEQWRGGQCTSPPLVVDIPFSQLGEFVYHCHISAHSDGGMMAKIRVVPWAGATPVLMVDPTDNIASSGNQGGPFSPSSFQYQLQSSTGSVDYSVSGVPIWLTASSTAGTVTASPTTITFTVNSNADSQLGGVYNATIVFTDTTNNTIVQSTSATLTVTAPQTLLVSSAINIFSSGNQGGPFSPSTFQYQLAASSGSINYSISGLPAWLNASATSGTLTTSPAAVTFTVNSNANNLSTGTYNAVVGFANTTNGRGNQSRIAALMVNSDSGGNAYSKTHVSARNGTDAGNCPVAAPCATLNYALSVTGAGGEVTILDGRAFGPVVLTQAVAINGSPSEFAQIVADPSAQVGCVSGTAGSCSANNGYAVEIAAGTTDVIKLGNLSMQMGSSGGIGALKLTSGGQIEVTNDVFRGDNAATTPIILMAPNASSTLSEVYFSNSDIGFNNSGNANAGAVLVQPQGTNSLKLHFNHVEVHNASYGIDTDGSFLSGPSALAASFISESEFFSFPNAAVNAFSTSGTGTVNAVLDFTRILNAGVALKANGPQSFVIVTNNTVGGNTIGVQQQNGATVITSHNSTITGNGPSNNQNVGGALTPVPLQ